MKDKKFKKIFEARTDDNYYLILGFSDLAHEDSYFCELYENQKFLAKGGPYVLEGIIYQIRLQIGGLARNGIIYRILQNDLTKGKEITLILP